MQRLRDWGFTREWKTISLPRGKYLTDGGSSLSSPLAFIMNDSASHKIDLYDATKLDVQYTIACGVSK